eukprot:1160088-Pelagomonas_calceolata.AAC.22
MLVWLAHAQARWCRLSTGVASYALEWLAHGQICGLKNVMKGRTVHTKARTVPRSHLHNLTWMGIHSQEAQRGLTARTGVPARLVQHHLT